MQCVLLFLILVSGCYALAQDCTQTLPINVLDQKMGTGVEALQSSLFQARMGDLSIPIIGVQKVEHRRVLVLVDQSGSMARRNRRYLE